jgi:hypothetical protein
MKAKHVAAFGVLALCGVSGLADAATLSGYAGFPDPFSDGAAWFQNVGRLELAATDTSWHRFNIAIPLKTDFVSSDLTVKWQHNLDCGSPCLNFGDGEVRVVTFDSAGAISGAGTWIATSGGSLQQQTVTVPSGGTALFQVKMRADSQGLNNHYISRVISSGVPAL